MSSSNAIHIRPANVAERSALEALQWRASLGNPGDREALLAHPDAIELPAAQIAAGGVFVAEDTEQVVGFAALERRQDGTIELDALFVDPGSQRQGIGRALVDYCAARARGLGATALHVVGNPHAERFYAACQFETVGEVATRFGPGQYLRRRL